ncbi:hypothetical protein Tcan_10750 [Toxocara canis]|uniref:Uncharacterized protein n=2 Tax=Toxocara canis TaxID=6265 RepID=A0A0B2V184_TOXCA|nr:hypothetical protein Tcan_10750 [Toxocara canis]VDM49626.1 unnamed protein product [Toxocara canis]
MVSTLVWRVVKLPLVSALIANRTRFTEVPLLGVVSVLVVHAFLIYHVALISNRNANNSSPLSQSYTTNDQPSGESYVADDSFTSAEVKTYEADMSSTKQLREQYTS